ncbi:MAG: flagellar protein FlgN [Pseudomonadaceae bacterium]|nr:flagellar protein FlgN [Pseudomonadaceae bacterium]
MTKEQPIDIETHVSQLTHALEELLAQIAIERDCLARRDAVQLASSTERKAHLIDRVNQITAALPAPLPTLIDNSSGPQRAKLEADHNSLIELAEQARDSNAVNGKIIARSQQSARELLAMMTASESNGLYGSSGYSAGPHSIGASVKA